MPQLADGDPREFTIETERHGFAIVDPYGEYPDTFMCLGRTHHHVYADYAGAFAALDAIIADWLDNYEPKECGDAWAGGFADNH